MIHPAPTTKIDPTHARGVLHALVPASGNTPEHVVIEFPNTSYQIHLVPTVPITSEVGKRIIGVVRVEARRVDVVDTGGRYFEPVFGRPRRVQGRVIAHDETQNAIVVDATVPIHMALTDARQRPGDFAIGDLVSCDVRDGGTFTPAQ